MAEFVDVISEANRMCNTYWHQPAETVCNGCPASIENNRYGMQECGLSVFFDDAVFDHDDAVAAGKAAQIFENIVMTWSERNRSIVAHDRQQN